MIFFDLACLRTQRITDDQTDFLEDRCSIETGALYFKKENFCPLLVPDEEESEVPG